MSDREKEFRKKLLATFAMEASEHIRNISNCLFNLEKDDTREKQHASIEPMHREFHSLKGAARAVGKNDIESICQSAEGVLSILKKGEIQVSTLLTDFLHEAVGIIEKMSCQPADEETNVYGAEAIRIVAEFSKILDNNAKAERSKEQKDTGTVESGTAAVANAPVVEAGFGDKKSYEENIRMSADKLNSLFLQVEEMLSLNLIFSQRTADINKIKSELDVWRKEWSNAYDGFRKLLQYFNEAEVNDGLKSDGFGQEKIRKFIEWNNIFFKSLNQKIIDIQKQNEHDRYVVSEMAESLFNDMKMVLMLPVRSLLDSFPRFVHELSQKQGKDIELVIKGDNIEIDRRIFNEIKDPLMHMIRNSIDHGIETTIVRQTKDKPLRGRITIEFSQISSSKFLVTVSDDGAGIDISKVRSAVLKNKVVNTDNLENMSEKELVALVFRSGVSTSSMITDISGRGLGLAIVQEKARKLGGHVSIETCADKGTSISMELPLTLAEFRGVIIRSGKYQYIIPTVYVRQVQLLRKSDITTKGNRETILFDDNPILLIHLDDILTYSNSYYIDNSTGDEKDREYVIIVGASDKCVAFVVDEIVNEQEVLMKSFCTQLSRVRNVLGASILGSGRIAPILNVSDLVKSAFNPSLHLLRTKEILSAADKKDIKKLLVVDDSITSRMLLKNILETAGYDVCTAVDGIDAISRLRTSGFDVVVSDVDMPGINGFELTTRIRSDKELSELPIILLTALDSDEDRKRGIDVGASAYIVKSNFEQNNLLDTIKRLI